MATFGEALLHRIAHLLVHRAGLLWLLFFVGMVTTSVLQFKTGRFRFRSAYAYDLFVPWDAVVTQQEGAFQAVYRPQYQLHFDDSPSADGPNKYVYKSQKLTWAEARDACAADGLVFAAIHTREEMLQATSLLRSDDVWLGGSDQEVEGVWTWVVNDAAFYHNVPDSFEAWDPGEPNNWANEDCLTLRSRWNDDNCEKRKPFLCMTPPPTPPPLAPQPLPMPPLPPQLPSPPSEPGSGE